MKINFEYEVTSTKALEILCETLHMKFALDEDEDFYIQKNSDGELSVYKKNKETGELELYDDRGNLFVAIRNLVVAMYPNVYFRSDNYIYIDWNVVFIGENKIMTEQEMIEYLKSTGLYEEHEDFFYEKEMLNTNKTVPISDLVERFIGIDKEFEGRPWNILQILTNINMIIPVEDRK